MEVYCRVAVNCLFQTDLNDRISVEPQVIDEEASWRKERTFPELSHPCLCKTCRCQLRLLRKNLIAELAATLSDYDCIEPFKNCKNSV